MRRLAIFALAIFALGATVVPADAEVATVDHIVVFDAPPDFPVTIAALGFTQVEAIAFQAVDVTCYRVGVPRNETAAAVIGMLKTRYPAATVDTETTEDFTSAN